MHYILLDAVRFFLMQKVFAQFGVCAFNPKTLEAEAGASLGVRVLCLHRVFPVNQG